MTREILYSSSLNYRPGRRISLLKKLSLKLDNNQDGKKHLYVDLRYYSYNRPTELGICVTICEFHRIVNALLFPVRYTRQLNESLRLIPSFRHKIGVNIEKITNNQPKAVFINESEIEKVILKFREMLKICIEKRINIDECTNDMHNHNCNLI